MTCTILRIKPLCWNFTGSTSAASTRGRPPLLRTGRNLEGNAVYETMWGPNEFTGVGNLKDWHRTDRLGEIAVPTLITVGRYDELTPACAETMHRGIAHAQMRVFEHSSHTAHLEETAAYLQVVREFLAHVPAEPL